MADRSFHRYSTAFPAGLARPTDRVELGPDVSAEITRRLLGDLADRRVLELGCGMGHTAVAMARAGARVTAIDPDDGELRHGRDLAHEHEVSVEWRSGDLADLAFLPAEGFDLVVAVHSLAATDHAERVMRQVHRTLRPGGALVVSMPHPVAALFDPFDDEPDRVVRGYFDREPVGSGPSLTHRYTVGDLFSALVRSDFRVDTLVETGPPGAAVPSTLVLRAKT
ncbi:MAG: class I SAM-dependent methyltransferase [Acidimicrobiia bacterium]|nr:class I SAM-dependent methyltransferase [Acidimicrobiia bacterium]MDH5238876.1 class I SAM-dependent methyltransferase [Acidimicrobiia bacterium]